MHMHGKIFKKNLQLHTYMDSNYTLSQKNNLYSLSLSLSLSFILFILISFKYTSLLFLFSFIEFFYDLFILNHSSFAPY